MSLPALASALAPAPREDLGLLGRSPFLPRLGGRVDLEIKVPPPTRYQTHRFEDEVREVALPVTFTPFASSRPCTARCVFCSETLLHEEARRLSAQLRPGPRYLEGLRRALRALEGLPIGLSLSGLEATDDDAWLTGVLDALEDHAGRSPVTERVLYSNGSGLAAETTGARLLPRLQRFGLDRAELSRHHPDPARNDAIMRFRAGVPIRDRGVFERVVRDALRYVPVRLVCVLQARGVHDLTGCLEYLSWARALGVRDVVFRELSRLPDSYRPNRTFRVIGRERVGLEALLDELWPPGGPLPGFEPRSATAGYYYWNLRLGWRDVEVTFETSDYREMKARHRSGVVHKLVFHADGNLCADWDPDREVLVRTGEVA